MFFLRRLSQHRSQTMLLILSLIAVLAFSTQPLNAQVPGETFDLKSLSLRVREIREHMAAQEFPIAFEIAKLCYRDAQNSTGAIRIAATSRSVLYLLKISANYEPAIVELQRMRLELRKKLLDANIASFKPLDFRVFADLNRHFECEQDTVAVFSFFHQTQPEKCRRVISYAGPSLMKHHEYRLAVAHFDVTERIAYFRVAKEVWSNRLRFPDQEDSVEFQSNISDLADYYFALRVVGRNGEADMLSAELLKSLKDDRDLIVFARKILKQLDAKYENFQLTESTRPKVPESE